MRDAYIARRMAEERFLATLDPELIPTDHRFGDKHVYTFKPQKLPLDK